MLWLMQSTISGSEQLGKLLRAGKSKKNKLSEEDIAKILSDFDKDDSGTIEVYEFLGAITSRKHRDTVLKAFTNRSAIRKQFAKLDEDNDGEITRKEFQKCLEKCILSSGDLLIMYGKTQVFYEHRVPFSHGLLETSSHQRFNFTWRMVVQHRSSCPAS